MTMKIQCASVPGVRWGGGCRISEEMDVWKMEKMFLLLATLVCTGFLNGYQCVVCLLYSRWGVSWEGGLNSTPRANPHQYPNVLAIIKTPEDSVMEKKKPHSPPIETQSHKHTCHILGLPCSRGPKCSAAGEGGGEGGKFVVSSTTKWDKGRGRNSINIYYIYITYYKGLWAYVGIHLV